MAAAHGEVLAPYLEYNSFVMVDIKVWEALMDLPEDLEDMQVVIDVMSRLEQGPEAAGALDWDAVRDEL